MLPFKNVFDSARTNITQSLFPKSDREILIENLQKKSSAIEKVLQKQSAALSGGGTAPTTTELKEALTAAQESQTIIDTLKEAAEAQNTVSESLIQKVISSWSEKPVSEGANLQPSPSIPAGCNLVCPE